MNPAHRPAPSRSRPHSGACALAGLALLPLGTAAQEFALYISPPRVELSVKAGETRREILELQHVGRETGRFRIYTADWSLKEDGTVDFSSALAPGSCRRWVAIERRELSIPSNGRYRYRFEVTPPADAPAQECRFAVMVEGLDATKVAQGAFSFPVTGRIGVIVYAKVGDVSPNLVIANASVSGSKAGRVPVVDVRNDGNATGRLEGFLLAKDADGKEFEIAPDPSPILPGATRTIALVPVTEEGRQPPAIKYPLTVKGNLEWGKSRQPLDMRFAP
ncbi:MAG: hypothetical protein KIS74_03725 [Burkholderiales bacterium]|nr:hypothetical protein [Burkholderiales bacterium]